MNWTKTRHCVLITSQVPLKAAVGSVLSAEMVSVQPNSKRSKWKDRFNNLHVWKWANYQAHRISHLICHVCTHQILKPIRTKMFQTNSSMLEGPNGPMTFQPPPNLQRFGESDHLKVLVSVPLHFQTLNNAMSPKEHPLATPRGFHVPKLEIPPAYEYRTNEGHEEDRNATVKSWYVSRKSITNIYNTHSTPNKLPTNIPTINTLLFDIVTLSNVKESKTDRISPISSSVVQEWRLACIWDCCHGLQKRLPGLKATTYIMV